MFTPDTDDFEFYQRTGAWLGCSLEDPFTAFAATGTVVDPDLLTEAIGDVIWEVEHHELRYEDPRHYDDVIPERVARLEELADWVAGSSHVDEKVGA